MAKIIKLFVFVHLVFQQIGIELLLGARQCSRSWECSREENKGLLSWNFHFNRGRSAHFIFSCRWEWRDRQCSWKGIVRIIKMLLSLHLVFNIILINTNKIFTLLNGNLSEKYVKIARMFLRKNSEEQGLFLQVVK